MRFLHLATLIVLGAGVLPVHAAGDVPAALAARLEVLVPNMEPDYIVEAPLAGMYEVRFGSIIVYLSGDGRYMLRGDLIDLDTRRNVTESARETVRAETVGALGEANMIVFAPDAPKYTITVFTDVDCGYCARMHRQMADYNRLGIGSPVHRVSAGRNRVADLGEDGVGVVCGGSAHRDDRREGRTRRRACALRQPGERPVRGRQGDRGERDAGDRPGVGGADTGVRSAGGAPRPAGRARFGLRPGPGSGVRVVYILAALVVVLGWLSFEMRSRNRDISQVLFAFTILAAVALAAAALGLY